jgi:hypothetical protein
MGTIIPSGCVACHVLLAPHASSLGGLLMSIPWTRLPCNTCLHSQLSQLGLGYSRADSVPAAAEVPTASCLPGRLAPQQIVQVRTFLLPRFV